MPNLTVPQFDRAFFMLEKIVNSGRAVKWRALQWEMPHVCHPFRLEIPDLFVCFNKQKSKTILLKYHLYKIQYQPFFFRRWNQTIQQTLLLCDPPPKYFLKGSHYLVVKTSVLACLSFTFLPSKAMRLGKHEPNYFSFLIDPGKILHHNQSCRKLGTQEPGS